MVVLVCRIVRRGVRMVEQELVTHRKRVLVVDDEPKFCYVVAGFLMGRGYETLVASSSDEALAKMEQFNPEVVLMDVRMPGRSGFEVVKEARARFLPPRIIMVTAVDSSSAIDEAMDSGADAYLCKPVDLNDLERLIATI